MSFLSAHLRWTLFTTTLEGKNKQIILALSLFIKRLSAVLYDNDNHLNWKYLHFVSLDVVFKVFPHHMNCVER